MNDLITVASGAVPIYGGRHSPIPDWAVGAVLRKPVAIPNSAGAAGAPVNVYSGYGVQDLTLWSVRSGGHESSDNRVTSIDLSADSPVWVERCPATPVDQRQIDVFYYSDGKPTSVHNYDTTYWVPQIGRMMQVGQRGTYGNPQTSGHVNAFDPATNTWDAAGTWSTASEGGMAGAFDPTRGRFWTNTWQVFDAPTNTYLTPEPITTHPVMIRASCAYDSLRDQFFSLQWGDGFGSSMFVGMQASKWSAAGTGAQVAITFNDSAAYTQFLADDYNSGGGASFCAGITYDSANDCFYWCDGRQDLVARIYIILPNATSVWDMEILQWGDGSTTPAIPVVPAAGLNGRLKYLPSLKGFIICPTGIGDIYFVRTS